MKKSAFLLTAAAGLLFTACTKESSTSSGPSAAQQAILGKWRKTYSKSFTLENNQVVSEVNLLGRLDSCALDDLYEFRADKTFWTDQGDNKCFPFGSQQTLESRWELRNNDRDLVFIIDSPQHETLYHVLEIKPSRLEVYLDSTANESGEPVSVKKITVYEK